MQYKVDQPPMHSATFCTSSIMIYTTEDNQVSLDVMLNNDTIWLNRHQLSILFDRDIKTIGKHINNALKEYLVKGYAINESLKLEHYNKLKDVVRLLASTVKAQF